jgi:hypothetical protein
MAHFAKLDDNNVVIAVHVVNNDVITIDGVESEQAGIDFLTQLHGHLNWKQTSYNGSIRKNYAGIDYKYDATLDAFVSPQPYPSWTLDANAKWIPPIPRPEGNGWKWDEENQLWVEN